MAIPYSYDLRMKVLGAIDGGLRKSDASRLFQISRNKFALWLKRRATTGDVLTLSRQEAASGRVRRAITNTSEFEAFVREHPSATRAELAQLWKDPVSRHTVGRVLRKIRYTRKKRLMATLNETNSNEVTISSISNHFPQKSGCI